MRLLRRRDGQIVIPAMLIFPALMLFVYLIYETAKLSREKIRHQFAMDAAAFVEMTNYSDFLNRTAYVNGAFPMRIFDEGYGEFMTECEGKTDDCKQVTYASVLFDNGVFPHVGGDPYPTGNHLAEENMPGNKWEIAYGGLGAGKNSADPDLPEPLQLFTREDARKYWHSKELAVEIFKLYVQIYSLLGSVEDAQWTVLKRLVSKHSFMSKSYWLNTGEPEGEQLVERFRAAMPYDFGSDTVVQAKCQQTLDFCGNVRVGGGGLQPYRPECVTGNGGDPPAKLEPSPGCTTGLFQMMVVKQSAIDAMQKPGASGYPGIALEMNWALPSKNYFNVDFLSEMNHRYPTGTLHTTIALTPRTPGGPEAAVWPNPTPKFQVRQFP